MNILDLSKRLEEENRTWSLLKISISKHIELLRELRIERESPSQPDEKKTIIEQRMRSVYDEFEKIRGMMAASAERKEKIGEAINKLRTST